MPKRPAQPKSLFKGRMIKKQRFASANLSASYRSRRPSINEKKFFDVNDTTDVTTTGTVTPLNIIRLGSDDFNRVGRKLLVKSIQVRTRMALENTANGSTIRMALVYDKQTNGALPAIADIWDTGTAASPELAMNNLNNRDRFSILMDEVIQLDQAQAISYSNKFYKKVNLECVYGIDAATIAEISTGGLYWVTIGSVAAGTTDVDQSTTIRLRYMDS